MSAEKAKKWDGLPHLKIVSPKGEVLHDGPTAAVPNVVQDYQASLEIAEAIKEYGGHEKVPKEVWRGIIERMCVRLGWKSAPIGAAKTEPDIALRARYAKAVCNMMAGDFDSLTVDELIDVALLNRKTILRFEEWKGLRNG